MKQAEVTYSMRSYELPDVHIEKPQYPIPIDSVGISDIKLPPLRIGNGFLIPVFNVYVDLPKELRGAHLSRLYRVIWENYNLIQEKGFDGILDLAVKIFESNDYAEKAIIEIHGEYFFESNKGLNHAILGCSVIYKKTQGVIRWVSYAEVEDVLACPCALKVSNFLFNTQATHMQKARVSLRVESSMQLISPLTLLDLLINTVNMPINLLSRKEEAIFVNKIFSEPRFTEDAARKVLTMFFKKHGKILNPNDTVFVEVVSFETIHQYRVVSRVGGRAEEFEHIYGEDK
ncbi:MAG: GTP cyclohydrolase, FolE2/MptA family [Thermosphaera sp.]